jgi:transcriptional regulator with XRE-family HTH domain
MSQTDELINTLKAELRRQGITYAEVARQLGVSESTIKRQLASGQVSLQRLAELCAVADLEIADLSDLARDRRRDVEQLGEAQEMALVDDPKLLLMAFLLLNDWRVDQIVAEYSVDELEAVRLLARLDRLKVIDLMPGNRPRMRLSRRFAWRRNGPIQRFFERQVQDEFFSSRFDRPHELRLVLNGMLSEQSIELLHQRFRRLAEEFEARIKEDRNLSAKQRHGTSAVLAIRPWSLSMFERLRRQRAAQPNPRKTARRAVPGL